MGIRGGTHSGTHSVSPTLSPTLTLDPDSLRAGSSNSELALAFALGIFIGLTPFYLLQTILSIYFARRLHLTRR